MISNLLRLVVFQAILFAVCLASASDVAADQRSVKKDALPSRSVPSKQSDGRQDQDASPQEKEKPRRSVEVARRWLRKVGQLRTPAATQRMHGDVLAAFRDVVAEPSKSTVAIFADDERIALGAIVAADGYVLTKASQLKGELQCRLADGRRLSAKIVRIQNQHDLAILKIDARDLIVLQWSDDTSPAVGSWLATTGLGDTPTAIGVVSVAPRSIPAPRGVLGVMLANHQLGPRIDQVLPDSGAEQAGLQVNDVITRVNGNEVGSRAALIRIIGRMQPGDKITLTVRRGDRDIEITAVLGTDELDVGRDRRDIQNTLVGPLSQRRNNFPSVLQHDSVLRPNDCGGPIVDLDGRAIGINIARAGRVASYAVPVALIRPFLQELKSGELAAIEDQPRRMASLDEQLDQLRNAEQSLTENLAISAAALEEAREAEAAASQQVEQQPERFQTARQQRRSAAGDVRRVDDELRSTREEIEQLESQKAALAQDAR